MFLIKEAHKSRDLLWKQNRFIHIHLVVCSALFFDRVIWCWTRWASRRWWHSCQWSMMACVPLLPSSSRTWSPQSLRCRSTAKKSNTTRTSARRATPADTRSLNWVRFSCIGWRGLVGHGLLDFKAKIYGNFLYYIIV